MHSHNFTQCRCVTITINRQLIKAFFITLNVILSKECKAWKTNQQELLTEVMNKFMVKLYQYRYRRQKTAEHRNTSPKAPLMYANKPKPYKAAHHNISGTTSYFLFHAGDKCMHPST